MENAHAEYRRTPPGAGTALVFIHGICGSPRQFDFLIEGLDEGLAVYNLLLPGHGRDLRDFNHSGMKQWQGYVCRAVERLGRRYARVILAGHSMGCLLAMRAALSYPAVVSGLFLLAPPLVLWPRPLSVKNSLMVALGLNDHSKSLAAALESNSVRGENPFEHLLSLPRYLELARESAAMRKDLDGLRLPVWALHLGRDELVSRRSLGYFSWLPKARTFVIPGAGHYYFPQKAREEIAAALNRFIEQLPNP